MLLAQRFRLYIGYTGGEAFVIQDGGCMEWTILEFIGEFEI
jgi:hypothetical protein